GRRYAPPAAGRRRRGRTGGRTAPSRRPPTGSAPRPDPAPARSRFRCRGPCGTRWWSSVPSSPTAGAHRRQRRGQQVRPGPVEPHPPPVAAEPGALTADEPAGGPDRLPPRGALGEVAVAVGEHLLVAQRRPGGAALPQAPLGERRHLGDQPS